MLTLHLANINKQDTKEINILYNYRHMPASAIRGVDGGGEHGGCGSAGVAGGCLGAGDNGECRGAGVRG